MPMMLTASPTESSGSGGTESGGTDDSKGGKSFTWSDR